MKTIKTIVLLMSILAQLSFAQDSSQFRLRLGLSLADFPQNFQSAHPLPSAEQSVELSEDLYDLSFWGISALSHAVVRNAKHTLLGGLLQQGVEYGLGFAFAKYGSELPIPLGVFTHEEFHSDVLGSAGYSSLNGNSLFNRWDGTAYGVTDEELTRLKADNLATLLYSYVAGVQSETYLTERGVLDDFYHRRSFYKGPLYLYNALYVWDYFHFAASPESDAVKQIAPAYESPDPFYRDYAGADLTAWIFDMFGPTSPYTSGRAAFPNGNGVNRRVGFSDLTPEGQDYLKKQELLSLLNFVNPAIFTLNRISIGPELETLFFLQYSPTNFGNDIALFLPVKYKQLNHLLAFHLYGNSTKSFVGLRYGLAELRPLTGVPLAFSPALSFWVQPESQGFYDATGKVGGSLQIETTYELGESFAIAGSVSYKTEGWMLGNPYLGKSFGFRCGVKYKLL